ncbi:aldo/keto reductase [Jeotgalicoccus psychrophilus]|uniref:aldo/keto reductase n=1 Tax=Jeotgalicoccus psychrophilus TaxID=157228 RepID=UPI0004217B41|nr:aldo/keto reductase [Jeotgalicoccus psychrophilus]
MQHVKLNNGLEMPIEGYGVFQVKPDETERCVLDALETGYRSLDTAATYGNEEGVGNALKKSGIPREEIFLTSKLWVADQGYEKAKKAFEKTLNKLGTDYLDLYLIHQPLGDYYGSWRALEELYKDGKIKAIGLSNFDSTRLVDLIVNNEIVPAVNQIELHPFLQQKEAQKVMKEYGVKVESWGPLAEAKHGILDDEMLNEIAAKHDKSVAQVILRWHLEQGIIIIPKSVRKERMAENLDVHDFSLDESDMEKIAELDGRYARIVDYDIMDIVTGMNASKTPE